MAELSDPKFRKTLHKTGWFGIQKPTTKRSGGRASFKIQQHTPDGVVTLDIAEVELVNEKYAKQVLGFTDALQHVELIKKRLYELRDYDKPKIKVSNANLKVLNEFLAKRYPQHKQTKLADFYSMKQDLTRAVGSLEGVPLLTASHDELQEQIDQKYETDVNKQRRVVSRLNSILQFLGRGITLDKFPEDYHDVRHLTAVEVDQLAFHTADPYKQLLYRAAFGSGLRIGELFGLRPSDIRRNNQIYVARQMKVGVKGEHRITKTKTRRERDVVVVPEYFDAVQEWANLSDDKKRELRTANYARDVKTTCSDVFNDPLKHCVFHDLRHSYAIHCLSAGMSMEMIALFLGNSVAVCEKYYTGFKATSVTVDMALMLLKSRAG